MSASTRSRPTPLPTYSGPTGADLEARLSRLPPPEDNAPLACYLLSERAAGLTGQIVRLDDHGITVVSHPAVLTPPLPLPAPADVDLLDEVMTTLAAQTMPLGLKISSDFSSFATMKTDLTCGTGTCSPRRTAPWS